jgi:isocitrate/isopropylmalate dehydrogenase
MPLEPLGFPGAEDLVLSAMKAALARGIATPDIGGKLNTREVTSTICDPLRRLALKA